MVKKFFTSESVTEGHPDKICDQISDAVLDALLEQDPDSRVACETVCTTGMIMCMGEISTKGYADISKLADYADEKINIGDTVTVIDCGNEIRERVIRLEYYPYQSDDTVISVGRVKKDLFFYLEQIGTLAKRYKKVSTTGGKVKAKSVSGVISQSGMKINGENGTVSLLSDIIEVSTDGDVKTQIGNVNGQFVFNITDNNGNSAVNITDKGNMNFKGDFETEKLSVGNNVITQDSNGVLCINGKRILVEGE